MGNCPSELRAAIRVNDNIKVKKLLDREGSHAAKLINEDHSADCILDSINGVPGNALYYAVSKGRYPIAELMLEYKPDIYTTGINDESIVHCAAYSNALEFIKKVVEEYHFDLSITDDSGRLPLHCACSIIYSTTTTVDYLLSIRPQDINAVDYGGRTPLHCALIWRNERIAGRLLKHGADVTIRDKAGKSAVDIVKADFPSFQSYINQHLPLKPS